MSNWVVRQGDSSGIKRITIKGLTDYTNYLGELYVLDKVSGRVVKQLAKASADPIEGFTVVLPPEFTRALGVGTYLVVYEITSVDMGVPIVEYRKELEWEITINKSLINDYTVG